MKLFLVMRVRSEEVKEDDDGVPEEEEYVWACCPFTAHADAPAALAKAHAVFVEMGCPHLIPSMRVIYVGYDMFAAATTLSCSDLTIRFTDGDSEQRVHYLPKSMVLCHAMLKQLNVLYQMLGRSMNLLQSIILDGYTIDVLTHPYTLARVKCYYLIEQFMVKCMKGRRARRAAPAGQDDGGAGAVRRGAERKTFGLPVDEFLGKSRVGLRNLPSLNATLDKGDKRNGGELVDLSDLRAPRGRLLELGRRTTTTTTATTARRRATLSGSTSSCRARTRWRRTSSAGAGASASPRRSGPVRPELQHGGHRQHDRPGRGATRASSTSAPLPEKDATW